MELSQPALMNLRCFNEFKMCRGWNSNTQPSACGANTITDCRGRDTDRQLKYICGQLRKEKDRHLDKLLGTEE